jgi:hypothetical protein
MKNRPAYKLVFEKPEGMSPLGKPGRRWYENVKTFIKNRV